MAISILDISSPIAWYASKGYTIVKLNVFVFVELDDDVYAFEDIAPAAPVHVLVVPKKHISSAAALAPEDAQLLWKLFEGVNEVARIKGIDKSGYRVVTNVGKDAGQSVFHMHIHVLGGKAFGASFG